LKITTAPGIVFPALSGPFDNSFGTSKLCALQRISLLENT